MVFCAKADYEDASSGVGDGDVSHHRIVFLGPPGSGKGTAATELSEVLNVPHLSTGEMFREAIRKGGPLGKAAKQFIDNGQLVPDEITMEVVRLRLDERSHESGFIWDGFPRTRAQAEAFDRLLSDRSTPITVTILLEVSDAQIVERVLGRVGCERCGALYHGTRLPPQFVGVCDHCGGRLTQRTDDTEEIVRKRIDVYRALTLDLARHYDRTGILQRVDGSRSKNEVFADILKIVKS
jgi:adenylate kinase